MTNPELGEVCFACTFVSDTAAVGCLIEYAPTLMLRVERNLTLFRHARKNMAAACVTGIENGTYRVLVYDLESSGLPSSNPAVVIDSIEIRGLVLHGNVSQDLMSTMPSLFEEESPSLKTPPSKFEVMNDKKIKILCYYVMTSSYIFFVKFRFHLSWIITTGRLPSSCCCLLL